MGSIVAYFHKAFGINEHKFRANNRMRKEVKRIQKRARQKCWFSCDKCGELFRKEDLEHIDEVNEDFCASCMNMMKLARDDY